MTVYFENYGNFYCSLCYATGEIITPTYSRAPSTLKDCMEYLQEQMDNDTTITQGVLCDSMTGEIVMTIVRDNEDFLEDCDSDWDYNEDCGFDPYMGCYTDDC